MLVATHELDINTGSEQVYREVRLTRGYIALVDAEDFDRINYWKWTANTRVLKNGSIYVRAARWQLRRCIYLHHQVLAIMPWELNGKEVDHIDKNPLHCFKSNLRVVTHMENMANTSNVGSRGVCYNIRAKLWVAYLSRPGQRRIYLGYFKTEAQALDAVEAARCS